MKQIYLLFSVIVCMIVMCSCTTTTVTDSTGDVYKNMGIRFHTKDYIRKQEDMRIPDGIDENNLGKLPFTIAFPPNEESNNPEHDVIGKEEFDKLKLDFQDMLAATNRFVLNMKEGKKAETEVRKRDGLSRVSEMDVSKMTEAKYILRVNLSFFRSSSQQGRQGIEEFKLSMNITPVDATTLQNLDWFPPFQCNVSMPIYKKVSSTGFVIAGINTAIPKNRQKIHTELLKKACLQMLEHIYTKFPAGGQVVDIDDENDRALVKANETTGLLPKLEMVVYAKDKNQPDTMPVELYNASVVSMAKRGSSKLQIWRRNSSNTRAQKIFKLIRTDWEQAKKQYDFWAASDGIADKPDFIIFEELK